ncbi:glycosyltransferase family 4 protein [Paenibacillus silviterrae]|uniref:glycosyltransferase family 4 protein n=1 Tax=Paenibacillus silviterrae TaxID=3242194 RepID=UPI002542D810|nr:glycosyltransferase family 4 protein [Paenibacillus chinjuensis]
MTYRPTIVIAAHDVGGRGGMELHLEEMITRLKREAQVIVVAASMQLKDSEGVRFIRIPVMDRPAPLKIALFSILASLRLLFLKRDLLHTTGAIVFNKADVSTVHFCHAGFLKETGDTRSKENGSFLRRLNSSLASKLSLWMEKRIYRPDRTRKLVAVSGRVRSELLADFPYEAGDIEVIPNGVSMDIFHPYEPTEKRDARLRLGLPEQGRLLLFMGGDWPRKGLDLVLKAFTEVADAYPTTRLLIVGKGEKAPYEELIEARHKELVVFAGKQPHPQDWFGVCDVFAFPTSYETFSLVVHEAAAAGLTIVTTRVGGVEDLIEHKVNGMLVNRDAASVRAALLEVLAEAEAGELPYGREARRKVECLTWDNTYRRMLGLYSGLLQIPLQEATGSRGLEIEHTRS